MDQQWRGVAVMARQCEGVDWRRMEWRNSGKGRFTWTGASEKKKTKSLGKV